jgi:hypothetical protein
MRCRRGVLKEVTGECQVRQSVVFSLIYAAFGQTLLGWGPPGTKKRLPKLGRTPACVKTCNSQDTMSATRRKKRSTVETNEIMKTAAHRSES